MTVRPDSDDGAAVTNGMPTFGLGTWQNTKPDECRNAVREALDLSNRHVDTAKAYENELSSPEAGRRVDPDSAPWN
jgi:2,5-diketo-D-gluconate reductase B